MFAYFLTYAANAGGPPLSPTWPSPRHVQHTCLVLSSLYLLVFEVQIRQAVAARTAAGRHQPEGVQARAEYSHTSDS